ncbi:hypothetical protein OS493_020150 [Desmophyllum pertusum]|uniref:Uncharacterized protein n=1 Tax=Desmophyllum pertusum TaxID=174260 RepID=A0A9X0D8W1_9CNID|nr:hypothetical protein OS493_020150 [Desmophyllum pertusum]
MIFNRTKINSEPFEPSTRVLFAGKPEYTPSCDQLSKIESTVECRGEIKSNFPSGIHQMSSFERACYEDFQTYIPEITPETQFVYTSKLCEDNGTVYGRVSPSRPAVNHNNVLTHYPSRAATKSWQVLDTAFTMKEWSRLLVKPRGT